MKIYLQKWCHTRVELFSVLDGSQSFVYLKHPKTALDYDNIMVGGGEVGHGTSWGCICCFIKEKNNPVKGGFKVNYFWVKLWNTLKILRVYLEH